ncbi:MAG: hypothetical protein V3U75_02085 [Methylococcaceae bacterium]
MPDWFMDAVDGGTVILNTIVEGECTIKTLEGNHLGLRGEYIIQGVKGEIYPCKPDIFEATYDVVIPDTGYPSVKLVEIGSRKFTEVAILDEPGAGNACHEYLIRRCGLDGVPFSESRISFQNGPVKESGINGCHHEDLIAVVIHRLQSFQAGDFKCRENALALTKLEEALHWLGHRTTARQNRGVEGKSIV